MKKLTFIKAFILIVGSISAQEAFNLKALFDSSEIVVQGTIAHTFCLGYSVGVEDCSYKMDVDSVYKGNPKVDSPDFIFGYDGIDELKIISFARQCVWSENCPGLNQKVILFLKEYPDNKGYFLADQISGFQPFNPSISGELKILVSKYNK